MFGHRSSDGFMSPLSPISTISTIGTEMFGHRSSSLVSQEWSAPSRSSAIRISTTEAGRRSKRSLPVSSECDPSSGPAWAILNRVGARKDCFSGDGTTSAVSRTSTGEEISVSFKFVEPPGTSILILDWPEGPDPMDSTLSYPNVIAAHKDAVLFGMTSRSMYPSAPVDYFVYQASSDPSQPSSLLRLPVCHCKGNSSADRPRQRIMSRRGTGLLSWSTKSFIVAELETSSYSPSAVDIYMFWSGPASEGWEIFPRIHVHCAKGHLDFCWWSTDAVLPFRRRYLVWVDYYRGMIIGDMGEGRLPHKLDLHYVCLPVDPIRGNPDDRDYGRGCPEASRSVCVAADGTLKFVIVNQKGSSFSISMWSLCEGYTWIEEATLDADQLWALDSGNCFPHVRPEFPVVNMKNPEAVCFLLNKGRHSADPSATTFMIEVHMKEQRLLEVTRYSKEVSLSNQNSHMTARMMSEGCSFISSELPFYLAEQMKRKLRKEEFD